MSNIFVELYTTVLHIIRTVLYVITYFLRYYIETSCARALLTVYRRTKTDRFRCYNIKYNRPDKRTRHYYNSD